ncbi:MAG: hypothetical protein IJ274_08630 [Lachnospiraceae bacterium]|nr:hypothetical protein [Lachnospiraceae bacterium]
MSKTMILHYLKLFYRSALFLTALVLYIISRIRQTGTLFGGMEKNHVILNIIWLVYFIEMILRFFPSGIESMGCQKQFAKNYRPVSAGENLTKVKVQSGVRTAAVAAAWLVLNGLIGVLYFAGVIDAGILLLISLAYSVCDMICILFFCPFQTWFMKNRCCTTCRIYNWDFAMMFTPLIFVKNVYAWSLVALSLALLIKWEVLLKMHPERFLDQTNLSLQCAMCEEKLCQHKTQLRRFILDNRKRFFPKDESVN